MADPRLVVHLLTDRSRFDMKGPQRDLKQFSRTQQVAAQQTRMLMVQQRSAAAGVNRYNQAVIQATFGVQDFAQVLGQPGMGLAGALRASVNNMSQVLMLLGGVKGALIGTAVTMGGMWIASMLDAQKETKKLADDMGHLNDQMKRLLDNARRFGQGFEARVEVGRLDSSEDVRERIRSTGTRLIAAGAERRQIEADIARQQPLADQGNKFAAEAIRRLEVRREEVIGDENRLRDQLDQLERRLPEVLNAEAIADFAERGREIIEQNAQRELKAKEEAAQKAAEIAEDREKAITDLFEATRTPMERFALEADRLKKLFPEGGDLFERGLALAASRVPEPERMRSELSGVAAVEAKSAEAFSVIQAAIRGGQRDKTQDKMANSLERGLRLWQQIERNTREGQQDWDL